MAQDNPPTLQDVYTTYQRWFYVEDTKRIDVALSVLVNRRLKGLPLWIFLTGPSGDWKSTQLETCEVENTVRIDKLTSRTLVSGQTKPGSDFCQKLWGKTIIIYDFAEVMSRDPTEKGSIFAQFRNLYDGKAGGSYGTGKDQNYDGKPPQMLVGCTHSIYDEYLLHRELGTRELLYRVDTKDADKARDRAMELAKSGVLGQAKEECRSVVQGFLKSRTPLLDFEVPRDVDQEIKRLTDELAIFRATAKFDLYTGELSGEPNIEIPTRAPMQLIQLYKALTALDRGYPKERALEILSHVVESSGDPITMKVYRLLQKGANYSTTNQITRELRLNYKTTYSRLNLLWALRKIENEVVEDGEDDGKSHRYWYLAKNDK